MKTFLGFALLSFYSALSFSAPDEAVVQGFYQGTGNDEKTEARVVAQGNGSYQLLLREESAPDKVSSGKLEGKTEGAEVRFEGKAGAVNWNGTYANGSIKLNSEKAGSYQLTRVERQSPTQGTQPPQGGIVYLDGKSLANLRHTQDGKQPATDTSYQADGSYQIPEHGVDSQSYGPEFEYDAHLEFKLPLVPKSHGWGRANANWFFLPNNSKITIVDSFGEPCAFGMLPEKEREKVLRANPTAETTFKGLVCGGIHGLKNPDGMERIDSAKGDADENLYPAAALPPLEWQTLDLQYRVPAGGKPRLTAFLNGVKIHDNVELDMPARKGVFHFRPSTALWRNFWVVHVAASAPKTPADHPANADVGVKEAICRPDDKPAAAKTTGKPDADLVIKHDIEIGKIGGIPILLETAVKKDVGAGTPLPAVLMIHGGGWKNGNARAPMGLVMPNPGLYYARNGYFVASVGYRLSGQAKWPAQIQDCKLAVRYLRAHAKELNIDPDHIGCCGFSAGGHLAGCLGAMQDAPEMEGDGGDAGISSRVQAVVMLSGPVDMTFYFDKKGGGSQAVEYKSELFGEGWKEHPEILSKASSNYYVKAGLPPFWIGASDKDAAVPVEQADVLADALKKAGVSFEYLLMKNGGHGLGPIKDHESKGIGDPVPTPEEAKEMTLRFLDKHLKPSSQPDRR